MRKAHVLLAVVMGAALSGCATVGPSSVRLAAETGERSAELGALHQELVRKYFALERARIDAFLRDEWEPVFLRHFLGTSGILGDLQEQASFDVHDRERLALGLRDYLSDPGEADKLAGSITAALTKGRAAEPETVRKLVTRYVADDRIDAAVVHVSALLGTAEPARLILEFASDAHAEMKARRDSLMKPLGEAEETILAELAASYAHLAQAHGTITARLEAASRAAQAQDDLLRGAGVRDPAALRARLAGISRQVGEALTAVGGNGGDPGSIIDAIRRALERSVVKSGEPGEGQKGGR